MTCGTTSEYRRGCRCDLCRHANSEARGRRRTGNTFLLDDGMAVRKRELPGPWIAKAACVGKNVGLFFVERGQTSRAAKTICATCPVISECLHHAMVNMEQFGVWGGLTEEERVQLRKKKPAA